MRSLVKQAGPPTETLRSWKASSKPPPAKQLVDTLVALAKGKGYVIVFDGLDEVATRKDVLRLIQTLVSQAVPVCAASRDLPDIRKDFDSHLGLEVAANREDVKTFLQNRFEDLMIDLSQELRDEFITTIIGRAGEV